MNCFVCHHITVNTCIELANVKVESSIHPKKKLESNREIAIVVWQMVKNKKVAPTKVIAAGLTGVSPTLRVTLDLSFCM